MSEIQNVHGQGPEKDTMLRALSVTAPALIDAAKTDMQRGNVAAAKEAIGSVISFSEINKDQLMSVSKLGEEADASPVTKVLATRAKSLLDSQFGVDAESLYNGEAELTPQALLHGAVMAKSTMPIMRAVTDYTHGNSNHFLSGIIGEKLDFARARNKARGGGNNITLDGLPTEHIQAALGWQEMLTKNERFSALMNDPVYQESASRVVSLGFRMGEDTPKQNAFILNMFNQSGKFSADKSASGQARYMDAMVRGFEAASQPRKDADGNALPGFAEKVFLSPTALNTIMDKTADAFSSAGGYVDPARVRRAIHVAATQYSKYVDMDLANLSSPESFDVLAEMSTHEALNKVGIDAPLSEMARGYRDFSAGRASAVTAMNDKAQTHGDKFILESGVAPDIVNRVSDHVAKLVLNDDDTPLRESLKEAGVSMAQFMIDACNPHEGHTALTKLVDGQGNRVVSDELLQVFKKDAMDAVDSKAWERSVATGIPMEVQRTMMLASMYDVGIDKFAGLDTLDDTVDKIDKLISNGTPEAIYLGAQRLLANFDVATAGMEDTAKVKALKSTLSAISTQATYMDKLGKVSGPQAEVFERTVVEDKKRIDGDPILTARLEGIAKEYQEAVDLKMDGKAEKLLLNYVATIDNVGNPFNKTAPEPSLLGLSPVINLHPMIALYRAGKASAKRTEAIKNIAKNIKANGGVLSVDTVLSSVAPYRMESASPKWFIPFDNATSDQKELGSLEGAMKDQIAILQEAAGGIRENVKDTRGASMANANAAGFSMQEAKDAHKRLTDFQGTRNLERVRSDAVTFVTNSINQLMEKGASFKNNNASVFAELQGMRTTIERTKDVSTIMDMKHALTTMLNKIEGDQKAVVTITEKQRLLKASAEPGNEDLGAQILRQKKENTGVVTPEEPVAAE